MPTKSELAAELRAMRKANMKPISRMGMKDISQEIESMKLRLAETPPVAAYPSAPQKAEVAATQSIKHAKAAEFPVKPAGEEKAARPKKAAPHKKEAMPKAAAPAGKKKSSKLERLLAMMGDESE